MNVYIVLSTFIVAPVNQSINSTQLGVTVITLTSSQVNFFIFIPSVK
ncbi:hypothetical protein GMMP1_1580002 [Candidatus Magnetomoraceae bacterium gMMP-1]